MGNDPHVSAALDAVDEDYYTLRPDGNLVTQSTAAGAIAEALDLLDVRPGMRVLEVGTGSGFSGALLAELAGPDGSVVSVDVVAELGERAHRLHRSRGRTDITTVTGDGALGAPGHGAFDRIVAWTTPALVPQAWVDQAAPQAVVLTPVETTPRVRTGATLRARVGTAGSGPDLEGEAFFPGGYVEMHSRVLEQWSVPPRGVDARLTDEGGDTRWLSAGWAADREGEETAHRLLSRSAQGPGTGSPLLEEDEPAGALKAYLCAMWPDEVGVVGLGGFDWGLGRVRTDGLAVLAAPDWRSVVHSGAQSALTELLGWVESWRGAGRPGHESLKPVLERADRGWRVRAELAR